jgi:NAD(P)H-hydrate epimerase
MVHGIESGQEVESLLVEGGLRYQAMVIGPGLGQSAWSQQMLQAVLRCDRPMVVDADGLNLLARMPPVRRDNWVLTPHPGEAARLLGVEAGQVQKDRFAAVRALQEKFGGVALLKGAGTLIADDRSIALCPYGNPGMASGGMGDVLTGVIGSLIAQGLPIYQAACLGACLHARAADLQASTHGEVGLLATDLYEDIRTLINFPDME